MAYPITDIRGIVADTAMILKSEGIRTTVGLLQLAKTPKQRLKIAEKVGTDDKCVLDWVTAADACRPDDSSQRPPQTGAPLAVGKGGGALDRERQGAAARHPLLIVRLYVVCALAAGAAFSLTH